MMEKYVFRAYDQNYPELFIAEKKKLVKALGGAVHIEHIGSTAIPGLGGKGILDIVVGVAESRMAKARAELEKAGYEFRENASHPERWFFRVDDAEQKRKRRVHVHLTIYNGTMWQELIGFRDYLLQHPKAAAQYAEIKKAGVQVAQGDGEKYRKHKEEFIQRILRALHR